MNVILFKGSIMWEEGSEYNKSQCEGVGITS